MRRTCGVLLLFLLCAGCEPYYRFEPRPTLIPRPKPYEGPYSEAADALAYVGCYRATFRERREDGTVRAWYILLDSLGPYPDRPGSGRGKAGARRASTSVDLRGSTGYWGKMRRGVQIDIGDSLHGVTLDLVPRDGILMGSAFFYTDTWGGYSVERVSARKIPCSEAAFPARAADGAITPREAAR